MDPACEAYFAVCRASGIPVGSSQESSQHRFLRPHGGLGQPRQTSRKTTAPTRVQGESSTLWAPKMSNHDKPCQTLSNIVKPKWGRLTYVEGEAPPNLMVHKFIVLADHFPCRPDPPEVESCCRWHPLLLYLGQPIGTDSVLPEAPGGTEVRILCVVKAICPFSRLKGGCMRHDIDLYPAFEAIFGMKPIGLGI